jgi:hypothetical protein
VDRPADHRGPVAPGGRRGGCRSQDTREAPRSLTPVLPRRRAAASTAAHLPAGFRRIESAARCRTGSLGACTWAPVRRGSATVLPSAMQVQHRSAPRTPGGTPNPTPAATAPAVTSKWAARALQGNAGNSACTPAGPNQDDTGNDKAGFIVAGLIIGALARLIKRSLERLSDRRPKK